jgi:hypothetical protein
MTDRLSKDEQICRDALVAAADQLGVVGEFVRSPRHNKFIVILPDQSTVTLAVYKTPACDAEQYARTLPGRLKNAIMTNLTSRKVKGTRHA